MIDFVSAPLTEPRRPATWWSDEAPHSYHHIAPAVDMATADGTTIHYVIATGAKVGKSAVMWEYLAAMIAEGKIKLPPNCKCLPEGI